MSSALILEARADAVWVRYGPSRGTTIQASIPPAASSGPWDWREFERVGIEQFTSTDVVVDEIEMSVSPEAVEGRVARVGVVCIGLARRPFERLAMTCKLAVSGAIDIGGVQQVPLDEPAMARDVAQLLSTHDVDALAVSGTNSGRNPAHEKLAASRIREWTRRPVLEARHWGDSLDAAKRAMAAARGVASLLILLDMKSRAVTLQQQFASRPTSPPNAQTDESLAPEASAGSGRTIPIRAAIRDPALLSAMLDAPEFAGLTQLFGEPDSFRSPELQARITRTDEGYTCHCTDGMFTFESITLARKFAAEHLREQLTARLARLGFTATAIDVQSHDRYTHVKGRRGPVRVYIETLLTARAKDA